MPKMMSQPDVEDEGMDAEEIAGEADAMLEGHLSSLLKPPAKPYSAAIVRELGSVLADISAEFGGSPYTAPKIAGRSVDALDGATLRMLAMVADAAAEYGADLPELSSISQGDTALAVYIATLKDLAADEEFKSWLSSEVEDEDMGGDQDDQSEEMGKPDLKSMLMSRMGRR